MVDAMHGQHKTAPELYDLIKFCAYGDLKEEMLRDCLVFGIRDLSLLEKLQTDPQDVRQKAAVKE